MFEGEEHPHVMRAGLGHPIDTIAHRAEIGRVALILSGTNSLFTDYARNYPWLTDSARYILDVEVVPRVLSLALSTRVILDFLAKGPGYKEHNRRCGHITTEKGNEKDLDLRTACNKLIHAVTLNYKLTYAPHPTDIKQEFFGVPMIYAGGTQGKKSWYVGVQCTEFLNGAANALSQFEQAPGRNPLWSDAVG